MQEGSEIDELIEHTIWLTKIVHCSHSSIIGPCPWQACKRTREILESLERRHASQQEKGE